MVSLGTRDVLRAIVAVKAVLDGATSDKILASAGDIALGKQIVESIIRGELVVGVPPSPPSLTSTGTDHEKRDDPESAAE